jgi:hypothetical protein
MKLLGIISMDFDVTDQLLIRFPAFVRYWRRNWSTMRQYISSLWTSRSLWVSEEGSSVKYSHRIWGTNETYSKARIGKHLSDSFPFQNGLKQEDAISPLLLNFALEYAIRKI